MQHTTFQAIGTHWEIQIEQVLSAANWKSLKNAITDRIETFDATYSRFREDSLVSVMAHHAGTYDLPPDGYKLLYFYQQLYHATGGKVTPLIGQTLANAGYDANYSFIQKQPSSPATWESVLSFTRSTITVSRPVLLDFGAAGKGYLVDIIGGLLEQAGVLQYVINAGGDIRRRGSGTLAIAMENPFDTTEAIGVVPLPNGSLCASAGTKRQWGTYHHIMDPDTLVSTADVTATWVTAADTMTADGLATALFFTAPEVLARSFQFSYALLTPAMQLQQSAAFPAKVFEAAT